MLIDLEKEDGAAERHANRFELGRVLESMVG